MSREDDPPHEPDALAGRYARRQTGERYSFLQPDVWQSVQERQRAMLRLFVRVGLGDLAALRVLEVGCGGGGNLLELLRIGFAPTNLSGIELLPDRFAQARQALPAGLHLIQGDALQAEVAAGSLDIVMASTVFSSLLDEAFRQRLAHAMWRWLKPGGAVLWYDFTIDNPRNRDVRGVPLHRLCALFPQGRVQRRRVTLAPPLARLVCRAHPSLYAVFNAIPLLRTHLLAWIEKPEAR